MRTPALPDSNSSGDETSQHLDALRRHLQRLVEYEDERPHGRGSEKRRHERHLCMTEVKVRYVKRFEQLSECPAQFVAITKDVSRSGLSFIYEHQMYGSEIVEVTLTISGVAKTLLVKVIRCRRAGLRVFDIAGEFITAEEAESSTPAMPSDE